MNRQTKQLLALAGVLAVGLGAYAALRVWNAGEEEREAAQADYVLQLSDVTALSFDSGDGPLSFTLEETGWTWDGDSEFPVNGTELDALREDLAALKAEQGQDGQDRSFHHLYHPHGIIPCQCGRAQVRAHGSFWRALAGQIFLAKPHFRH